MSKVCGFDGDETPLDHRILIPQFERVLTWVAHRSCFSQPPGLVLIMAATDACSDPGRPGTLGRTGRQGRISLRRTPALSRY